MASVKTLIIEHLNHTTISEHIRKHGTFFSKNSQVIYDSEFFDELEISTFASKDLDDCVDLYLEVFSSDPWFDDWKSRDQVRKYLIELMKNPVFMGYAAYSNKKLLAVCLGHKRSWWSGKEYFIDELFVSNEVQGKGLGTYLLDYVVDMLNMENCTRLTLLTNKNFPAEKFYLKNGFDINQERLVMIKQMK